MTDKKTKQVGAAKEVDTYQSLRGQLDEVLVKLQDPACDVDQAAGLYEQAVRLASKLEAHIEGAENRVHKLRESFDLEAEGN